MYSEIASIMLGFLLGVLWMVGTVILGVIGVLYAEARRGVNYVELASDLLNTIAIFTLASRATWERHHAPTTKARGVKWTSTNALDYSP